MINGEVRVARCNLGGCITDAYGFCQYLKRLLPLGDTSVVVYCDPVFKGEVSH